MNDFNNTRDDVIIPRSSQTKEGKEDEILSRAIQTYGEPAQVLKCIEELAELIEELSFTIGASGIAQIQLCKNMAVLSRNIQSICSNTEFRDARLVENPAVANLVSELADVSITTSQMCKMFTTPEEFEKIKQAKLSRLADRISREYNPGGDCGSIGDDETFEDIHGPVDEEGDSQ